MSFYLIRSKSKLRYVTHGMFLRIIVTKFSWKKHRIPSRKGLFTKMGDSRKYPHPTMGGILEFQERVGFH